MKPGTWHRVCAHMLADAVGPVPNPESHKKMKQRFTNYELILPQEREKSAKATAPKPRNTTPQNLDPDMLRREFPRTKNEELARRLGCGLRTLVRYARKYGIEKDPAWVRAVWKENCLKAQAANIGTGNAGIINLLEKGKAYRFKPGHQLTPEQQERRTRNMCASRRKLIASERRRILFGLPQRTKLKFGSHPQQRSYRHRLKKLGYIVQRGSDTVIYDSHTHRSPLIESRCPAVGIKVIEIGT